MKIEIIDADWSEIERIARGRIDSDTDDEQIAWEAYAACAAIARVLLAIAKFRATTDSKPIPSGEE